jgi:hypothetical protein
MRSDRSRGVQRLDELPRLGRQVASRGEPSEVLGASSLGGTGLLEQGSRIVRPPGPGQK